MTLLPTELFMPQDVDPIPVGTRIGDLVHGLRVTGVHPETGELGAGVDGQLHNAYEQMRRCVEQQGGSLLNVAHLSMYFADLERGRESMNRPWMEAFPDEADRPTYKFMQANLPGERLVHLEFFAVLNHRRQVLEVPGVAHTNPIPLGVRMGPYLFSSRILPYDPSTGEPPGDAEAQARFVFENVTALLEAGDMSWPDVRQGRAFLAKPAHLRLVERLWAARFPDAPARPALYALQYGGGALQVMLEVLACSAR